jgi:hypothetical protein
MLINYLKIAYRNIIKQRVYSFINVFGLAFGLTATILVGLFIYQDYHYDDYHKNGDNISGINKNDDANWHLPFSTNTFWRMCIQPLF